MKYEAARPLIKSGDLMFLHHEWTASWYGVQIEAVQRFTGPYSHVGMFLWVRIGGRDRLMVAESVVPVQRLVAVSATAEHGFLWMPLNREPSQAEYDDIADSMGFGTYSKTGAILAGADALPDDEDEDERRWCAKSVALWRRKSGVDLGKRMVPTDMALVGQNQFNAPLHQVSM